MSSRPTQQPLPVNPLSLNVDEFVDAFGALYEHSPWVAQRTFDSGLDPNCNTLDGLAQALSNTLKAASDVEKLALIRAHPDLAGKAAAAGTLTHESNDEQSSAGLDQCTPEELSLFHELNNAYKAKFDFPFIMAVKDSNRHLILDAFEKRIHNSPADEFATAINEINKIARLRLKPHFLTD